MILVHMMQARGIAKCMVKRETLEKIIWNNVETGRCNESISSS